jgi:SOUL heme-binding protein
VIRFFMPARWTSDTLPIPNDATVKLVTVPPETFAVLRFRGSWGRAAIAARTAQLMSAVQTSGYQLAGAPISWFYDPPWTIPLLRRNEVAVAVTPRS